MVQEVDIKNVNWSGREMSLTVISVRKIDLMGSSKIVGILPAKLKYEREKLTFFTNFYENVSKTFTKTQNFLKKYSQFLLKSTQIF